MYVCTYMYIPLHLRTCGCRISINLMLKDVNFTTQILKILPSLYSIRGVVYEKVREGGGGGGIGGKGGSNTIQLSPVHCMYTN